MVYLTHLHQNLNYLNFHLQLHYTDPHREWECVDDFLYLQHVGLKKGNKNTIINDIYISETSETKMPNLLTTFQSEKRQLQPGYGATISQLH
jgi:hypothetical protein